MPSYFRRRKGTHFTKIMFWDGEECEAIEKAEQDYEKGAPLFWQNASGHKRYKCFEYRTLQSWSRKRQIVGKHASQSTAVSFSSLAYVLMQMLRRVRLRETQLAKAQMWTIRERFIEDRGHHSRERSSSMDTAFESSSADTLLARILAQISEIYPGCHIFLAVR